MKQKVKALSYNEKPYWRPFNLIFNLMFNARVMIVFKLARDKHEKCARINLFCGFRVNYAFVHRNAFPNEFYHYKCTYDNS